MTSKRKATIEKERDAMRIRLAQNIMHREHDFKTTIVDRLPTTEEELAAYQSVAYIGAASVTFEDIKTRLVLRDTLIEVIPGLYETPMKLVTDYLKMAYGSASPGTREQLKVCEKVPPAPLYTEPTKYAHGVLVDIRACYWNIMRIAGWNVDYFPGVWLDHLGRPPYDWPWPEHKVARNSLVTAGHFTHLMVFRPDWKKDKLHEELRHNPLLNSQLARLISDVTHAIAYECVQAGMIYWNTDGGIAPNPAVASRCRDIIAEWGLDGRYKAEGPGMVKTNGVYQVGDTMTRNFHRIEDFLPLKKIIKPRVHELLKSEFSDMAKHAMRY